MTLPRLTVRGWTLLATGGVWSALTIGLAERDLLWPGLFLLAMPLTAWLAIAVLSRRPSGRRVITNPEVEIGAQVISQITVDWPGTGLGGVSTYRDTSDEGLIGIAAAVSLPASSGHRVTTRHRANHRGVHRVGPLGYRLSDPLGLSGFGGQLGEPSEVLALPRLVGLPDPPPWGAAGSNSEARTVRASAMGSDDVAIREYVAGDDRRRIHWRSTARTGALKVRREERTWDPSAVILLDLRAAAFGRARPEPGFEWMVSAAASIGAQFIAQGFTVWLVTATSATEMSGTGHLRRHLARVELRDDITTLPPRLPTTSGQSLVALTGRLDPTAAAELSHLAQVRAHCRALVRDASAEAETTFALLRSNGWEVSRVRSSSDLPAIWAGGPTA